MYSQPAIPGMNAIVESIKPASPKNPKDQHHERSAEQSPEQSTADSGHC